METADGYCATTTDRDAANGDWYVYINRYTNYSKDPFSSESQNNWYKLPVNAGSAQSPSAAPGASLNSRGQLNSMRRTLLTTSMQTDPMLQIVNELRSRIGYTDPDTHEEFPYYVVETVKADQILNTTGSGPWSESIEVDETDEHGNAWTYYIVEKNLDSNYELVSYSGEDDGLTQGGTAVITNQKKLPQKGSLLTEKNVTYNRGTVPDGKEQFVYKAYQFAVTRGDGTPIDGSPFTISVSEGSSAKQLIDDLDEGEYIIKETDSAGLDLTDVQGGIGSSLTQKSITVKVTAGKTEEAKLLDEAKAIFTNNYSESEIIVKKVDQIKAEAHADDRFIGGAQFPLVDSENRAVSGIKAIDLASSEEIEFEETVFTVPSAGIKIMGLPNGSYQLIERKAPDGYIINSNAITFTVADGETQEWSLNGEAGSVFEIPNPPDAALPNTGGPGTMLLYLLGGMLSLLAGAGLLTRRIRRRRTPFFL